jgi:arylsulfatase
MVEHDMHVGQLLALLDELGIADNTIVHYSTDNGPHMNTWPDAGSSPFFGEKNTNWEGGWRVPSMVRWPGKIEADSVSNEIMHHMDWFPTLLAAAGVPDIKEQLKKGGVRAIGRKFKVHLDGYNFLPHLTGETVPLMFNLRRDPYERSYRTSNTYYDWVIDRVFFLVPAQQYVGKFLATFKEFPPRQKPASFSIDQVMEKMLEAGGSK